MGEGWPSKRKYISMNVAFFAAIAAFLVVFLCVVVYKPGAATVSDLGRLTQGMTPAEVVAVIGEPHISLASTVTPGNLEETWTYYLHTSRWSVKTQTWQLKFYRGRLDTWWQVK